MGMRPHIQSMAGHELARSHLIKENERADHLPLAGWQRPAHLKPTNVVGAGYDDGLDGRGPLRECLITFHGYLPTRCLRLRPYTRSQATPYYVDRVASGSISESMLDPSYVSKCYRCEASARLAASSPAQWLYR